MKLCYRQSHQRAVRRKLEDKRIAEERAWLDAQPKLLEFRAGKSSASSGDMFVYAVDEAAALTQAQRLFGSSAWVKKVNVG
jgi:hypothetical protein